MGTGYRLYRSTDKGHLWHLFNNTFAQTPIIGLRPLNGGDTIIACAQKGVFRVYGQYVLSAPPAGGTVPLPFTLHPNYPNALNPSITIRYALAGAARVNLSVYNSLGPNVAELINSLEAAGEIHMQ